jgi:hypothetical protein
MAMFDFASVPFAAFELERWLNQVREQAQGPVEIS